jgi:hypothetical protein
MSLLSSESSVIQRLTKLWTSTHVSQCAVYSLERTLSLEEYSRSTTTSRTLLVLLCTPLPVLVFSLAIEAIPLDEPTRGWRTNYGGSVRVATLTMTLTLMSGLDTRHLLPGRIISNTKIILLAVIVTLVYSAMMAVGSEIWVYPIPFSIIVMSVPYWIVYTLTLWWLVGSEVIQNMHKHHPGAILRHFRFAQANMALIIVYPAFQALFSTIESAQLQLVMVIVLLPVIKMSMKQLMARKASHLDDLIPELVVVTVELFNALYTATCIQRLGSISTGLVVFAVDVIQNVITLRSIHMRTSRVWQKHREQNGPNWIGSLLTAVRTLIVTPRRFDPGALDGTKTRSCVPHKVSVRSQEILRSIEQGGSNFFAPTRGVASRQLLPCCEVHETEDTPEPRSPSRQDLVSAPVSSKTNAIRVAPAEVVPSPDTFPQIMSARQLHPEPTSTVVTPISPISTRMSTILLDSQRVLFTIEYVVLAEYFELFCQLFYVCYMAGLSHLPAVKYHAELADLDGSVMSDMLANNLLFVLLKLASFVMLMATLWWFSGHDALRHLAFVLETRMVHVQAKMIVWILMMMGFRVVHFGELSFAGGLDGRWWWSLTDSMLLQAWILASSSSGCTIVQCVSKASSLQMRRTQWIVLIRKRGWRAILKR